MAAVPVADPQAQQSLSQARSAAIESLHGKLPDPGLGEQRSAPTPAPMRGSTIPEAPVNGPGPDTLEPQPGQNSMDFAPGPDAEPLVDPNAPPPDAEAVKPPAPPTAMQGTVAELKDALPRGVIAIAQMAEHAMTDPNSAPIFRGSSPYAAAAAPIAAFLHPQIEKLLDTAAKYFTPDEGTTGWGAKLVGDAGQMLPALLTGPAAIPVLSAVAGDQAMTEAEKEGVDARTASAIALAAAGTNALGMKIPMKSPVMLKRVITGILGNVAISAGAQTLTKEILQNQGYQEAADKIDPLDPHSLIGSGIFGAIFGVVGAHDKAKSFKPGPNAEPTPDLVAGTEGEEPAPPADTAVPQETAPSAPPVVAQSTPPVVKPTESPAVAKIKAKAKAKAAAAKPAPAEAPAPAPAPAAADATTEGATAAPPPEAQPVAAPEETAPPAAEAAPPSPQAPAEEAPPKPTNLRTVKIGGEDVPVQVAGPAVDGKVPVRTIDEDGRPSKEIRQVPEHMLKEQGSEAAGSTEGSSAPAEPASAASQPKEPATVEPPTPPAADRAATSSSNEGVGSATAVPELQKAVDLLKQQEIPPAGKKFPGKVAERASWVSEFARAVKAAAAGKDVPEEIANDATAAAKAAERLDMKTPEAMAKNQGIGHTQLSMHVDRLLQAAHNILHPDDATLTKAETTKIAPKAERLKQKAAAAAEATAPALAKVSAEAPTTLYHGTKVKGVTDLAGKDIGLHLADEATARKVAGEDGEVHKVEITGKTVRVDEPADGAWHNPMAVIRTLRKAGLKISDQLALKTRNWEKETPSVQRADQMDARQGALLSEVSKELRQQGIDNIVYDNKFEGGGDSYIKLNGAKLQESAPAKPTKADQLKAAQAARLAAADKRAERVAAARTLVKSAIPDVEDVTKPKKLNAGETTRIRAAVERYMRVGDDEVQGAHDNLQRVLHEVYGEQRIPEAENILQLAREQRTEANEDRGRPRRMSDTVEEEDQVDDRGREESEPEEDEHRAAAAPIPEYQELGDRLDKFFGALKQARDKGQSLDLHKVLNHLINQSQPGPLRDLMMRLKETVPQTSIHVQAGRLVGPDGSLRHVNTRGLHSINARTGEDSRILLRGNDGENRAQMLHTLIHESVHAATTLFMRRSPDHPLVTELKRLHDLARDQYHAMSREIAEATGDYVAPPYGLTNPYEFAAEAASNPRFQQHLAGSSAFARGVQNLRDIAVEWVRKVGEMLGIRDKGSLKLLHNTMDVVHGIMKAQKDYLSPHTAGDELPHIEEHPLEHEEEFRSVAGAHATDVAGRFRSVIRSGGVESVRRAVRAFTPYSALVRAAVRRGVFGNDTPDNPLRAYDEAIQQRNSVINKVLGDAHSIVHDWSNLSAAEDKGLGRFLIDSTTYGIDPRQRMSVEEAKAALPARVTSDPKFESRWKEFQDRYKNLTDAQRELYGRVIDYNEKAIRANRKAGVNAALESFTDQDISDAKRRLLYAVVDPHEYGQLIGHGKEIDVGDRNDKLVEALQDLAGTHELEGPYAHLGRHGDNVVQVKPEGTKVFETEAQAQAYADKIRDLSRISKAKVAEVGGKWQVDYKAEYVSMHDSPAAAEAEIARLRAAGYDVGSATTRLLSQRNAPLTSGLQSLVAEAGRRIARRGEDDATEDLKEALRTSFLKIMAARSAYSGSKLARRGVGGVKPEEMLRNFATHAQSMAWNTGHLATVFKVGDALGKLREAVKDVDQPQDVANQRGRVYDELTRRTQQENAQVGMKQPFNAAVAKVGFLNFLTSPSHAIVNLTQNFTTAIPVAAARYGFARSAGAFGAAMRLISSPAFRETFRALGMKQDGDGILKAIVATIAKDPRFGKYARGENSMLQQLIDRGAIHQSFSNQLATMATGGGGRLMNRTFDYARLMPAFADVYNRVSTGLAALELTHGDVYKAGDFIKETHMDYTTQERPRVYRAANRLWGGNSIFMFKTYMTGMAHLLYSHIYDMAANEGGGRAQALKTVAGMMLGTAAFAGLQRSVGLEPLRLAMYAYHKLVGDDNEYHDFDNTSRRWVADVVGQGKVADVINGGLPRAAGFDMSSRLGLSDLMLHDPPDMLSLDRTGWAKFAFSLLGPLAEETAGTMVQAHNALASGRVGDFIKAVPIKAVQNIYNAYQYGTEGKVSPSGAKLMEPSGWNAFVKGIGFKPATEAKQEEKTSTAIDYKQFAQNKQFALIKQWASADPSERAQIWRDKIQPFNAENPGHRVTMSDLLKQVRGVYRQAAEANGQASRDPVQNKLANY
jgi:hypothetical protein